MKLQKLVDRTCKLYYFGMSSVVQEHLRYPVVVQLCEYEPNKDTSDSTRHGSQDRLAERWPRFSDRARLLARTACSDQLFERHTQFERRSLMDSRQKNDKASAAGVCTSDYLISKALIPAYLNTLKVAFK
jgi:hypothetical protein